MYVTFGSCCLIQNGTLRETGVAHVVATLFTFLETVERILCWTFHMFRNKETRCPLGGFNGQSDPVVGMEEIVSREAR